MGNSLEVIFWIIFLWFILYVHVFKVGLGKLDFFWQLEKMYNIQWWTEEEEGNAHFYFFTTFVFLSLNCLTTSILMCRIHYVQNAINFSYRTVRYYQQMKLSQQQTFYELHIIAYSNISWKFSIGRKLSHPLQIPLVAHHSKMYRICQGG